MIFKKDLMALKKDIRVIGKKVENLLKAFEKDVKAKVAKPSKAKAVKVKPAKKAPVKKKAVKTKPAKMKAVKATATDQVLNIINRSKKGVDTATIKKKTGFNDKRVRNILFRTYKEGKIKKADRGIYIGVK